MNYPESNLKRMMHFMATWILDEPFLSSRHFDEGQMSHGIGEFIPSLLFIRIYSFGLMNLEHFFTELSRKRVKVDDALNGNRDT